MRKTQHSTVLLAATLLGALAIAPCHHVHADIVYFVNPAPGEEGHFNWHANPNDKEDPTFEQWLDITRPSTDQFDLENDNSVAQLFRENGGDSFSMTWMGADVFNVSERKNLAEAFEFGEEFANRLAQDRVIHWYQPGGPIVSEFIEGQLLYMGVRTQSGNFGWIAVIRDFWTLNAVGWAYETEPGVPLLAGEGTPPVTAELVNFELILGDLLGGDLDSLRDVDDDTLDINSNFGFNSSEPNLFILRVEAVTPVVNPDFIDISTTSRTNQAGTFGALLLRNLMTGADDLIATYPRGPTEMTHTEAGIDPTHYIDSTTGQILMTHKHAALIVFSSSGFDSFIDQIEVALPPE